MAGANGKRLTGIILFIVAALGVAAFLFLLFADAEGLTNVPGTEEIPAAAIIAAIALGIIALILVILLLVRTYDRREADAAEAEAFFIPEDIEDDLLDFAEITDEGDNIVSEPEPEEEVDARLSLEKVVPHDLANVPLGSQAWGTMAVDGNKRIHSFHYPITDATGLYNNDYITINANGDQIKLRTLLAAPPNAFEGMTDAPIKPAQLPSSETTSDVEARLASRTKTPAKKAEAKKPAKKAAKKPAKKAAPAYYDYGGDVHDVIDVEGIGPVYAKRLQAIGVKTTARLCYEDPASLARSIQANEKSVQSWQTMAELMKVNGIGPQYAEALARAGVEGIADIKKRSAEAIAQQVNDYLEGLEVNVLGNKITPRRVEGWKKAVKPMRKTRRAIPEE